MALVIVPVSDAAVLAATFVISEPFKAGKKPAAVVWISWLTPLKVLPWAVILAVVTPFTAVALSEPPEMVAPSIVVAPVIAPDRANAVSVPTDVMLVYAVALLRLALVMTPVPVILPAVVAATFVRSEPFSAGRKPEALVCTSWLMPLKVLPAVVTVVCNAEFAMELAGKTTEPLATVRPARLPNPVMPP